MYTGRLSTTGVYTAGYMEGYVEGYTTAGYTGRYTSLRFLKKKAPLAAVSEKS